MTRRHWTQQVRPLLLLLLLYSSLLATFCQGEVRCRCTTSECQSEGEDTCLAQNICYVQYMPLTPDMRPDTPLIIRGCIDEQTPLLCENRRPQTYTGPWPVLYCCKDENCNEEVIPTIPTWVDDIEGQARSDEHRNRDRLAEADSDPSHHYNTDDEDEDEDDEAEDEEQEDAGTFHQQQPADHPDPPLLEDDGDKEEPSSRSSRRGGINPLYIGVPVAGACVLLAIIIFAIYILRRNNHYVDEYHYHENLKQQQQHHNHPHHYPNNQNLYLVQSRTAYPVVGTRDPRDPRGVGDIGRKTNAPYPDCERSSSGSETKLLMKV